MFSEVFDLKPTRTHQISRVSAGKAAICPEGTLDISRWCKPPIGREQLIQAPAGAAEIARRPFRRPCRGSPHFVVGTGGLHHRLISATPPAFVIDAVPKLRSENSAHLSTFLPVQNS